VAQAAKAIPNGHVISSATLTVNNDAYHFDGPGLREFGKRYAASYLQALKTTSVSGRSELRVPKNWKLREAAGNRTLEFNQPQDYIWIWNLQGSKIAEGSGRSLTLPNSLQGGIALFQASAGTVNSSGIVSNLP
jgi:hypothetical protein